MKFVKNITRSTFIRLGAVIFGITALAGCEIFGPMPGGCPSQFPFHYTDSAHGFSLCLPGGLTKSNAAPNGYPAGSVVFSGFAVQPNTNMVWKKLFVVAGKDPDLQGATPDGNFSAGGVTFTRSRASEGSAGHNTQYIIYTWTSGKQTLHFDFTIFSTNPGVYPPSSRPKQYDLAAEVKFSEDVMKTFSPLK